MSTASEGIKKLMLQRKRDERGASRADTAYVYEPPPVAPRQRPEDRVPNIPQNADVRDFLRRAGGPGAIPLGKEMTLSQCWRCKLYGHATGSRECPYFATGNIELEAERRVREDPLPPKAPRPATVVNMVHREEKLASLQQLLATVEREEEQRKWEKQERRRLKKLAKKERKERKKRPHEDAAAGPASGPDDHGGDVVAVKREKEAD